MRRLHLFAISGLAALAVSCDDRPGTSRPDGSRPADLADLSEPRDRPLERVTVTLNIVGSGQAEGPEVPAGCTASCTLSTFAGRKLLLRARPAPEWFFDDFQGSCAGTGSECELEPRSDQSVTVRFRRWSAEVSPTTTTLRAIWGRSARDIWAVGDKSTVLHYDGVDWLPWTLGVPVDRLIGGVYGNDRDVYVVGDRGMILRLDRDRWVQETLLDVPPADMNLRAIWVDKTSSAAVAVGTRGWILKRSAEATWKRESIDPGEALVAVWGSSSSDYWVTGGRILLHSAGGKWSVVDSSRPGAQFSSLAGQSDGAVWVGADRAFLELVRGTTWTADPSFPSSGDPVLALATSERGEVWASSGFLSAVFRRHRGAFLPTPIPGPARALHGLWSGASGETWAVGENGTLLAVRP